MAKKTPKVDKNLTPEEHLSEFGYWYNPSLVKDEEEYRDDNPKYEVLEGFAPTDTQDVVTFVPKEVEIPYKQEPILEADDGQHRYGNYWTQEDINAKKKYENSWNPHKDEEDLVNTLELLTALQGVGSLAKAGVSRIGVGTAEPFAEEFGVVNVGSNPYLVARPWDVTKGIIKTDLVSGHPRNIDKPLVVDHKSRIKVGNSYDMKGKVKPTREDYEKADLGEYIPTKTYVEREWSPSWKTLRNDYRLMDDWGYSPEEAIVSEEQRVKSIPEVLEMMDVRNSPKRNGVLEKLNVNEVERMEAPNHPNRSYRLFDGNKEDLIDMFERMPRRPKVRPERIDLTK